MSKSSKVAIAGAEGQLEALVEYPENTAAEKALAIVCHPHPLHGGTMQNKVVTTLVKTFHRLGLTTIRFNYRGVGESEGEYGYATGEIDDLKSVIAWGEKEFPEYHLWLAGFSFGAYIAARTCQEIPQHVETLVTIAPAADRFDFTALTKITCPWIVVMGDADEVVPPKVVFDWARSHQPAPTLIRMEGVGHFFHGKLIDLREQLLDELRT